MQKIEGSGDSKRTRGYVWEDLGSVGGSVESCPKLEFACRERFLDEYGSDDDRTPQDRPEMVEMDLGEYEDIIFMAGR